METQPGLGGPKGSQSPPRNYHFMPVLAASEGEKKYFWSPEKNLLAMSGRKCDNARHIGMIA